MNDITAPAQREKFEAWLEEAEALPCGYLKKRRTSDDAYHEPNTTDMWGAWQAASAEMVEALEKAQQTANINNQWKPDVCPITGRRFFMWIEHPELGYVPTYGGPFDSYTIPTRDSDGEFSCERFDHDVGDWVDGEYVGAYLIDDDEQCRVYELEQSVTELREQLRTVELSNSVLESRTVTAAASDVLAERQRQISMEGWKPEHDDEHVEGQLSDAAACYALFATDQRRPVPAHWPWSDDWWKQRGQRRDLVKAGALIIAEIERLDRAAGIQVIEGEG